MKRILFAISFVSLFSIMSCTRCMDCEITYIRPNGEDELIRVPQICGSGSELDEREQYLVDAYSSYDSSEVECIRD